MLFFYINILILITVIFLYENKNNIVIVFSKNYYYKMLIPFFFSLKKYSNKSYLLIFGDNYSISIAKSLYNEKVIGIEVSNNYPYYPFHHSRYPISYKYLIKRIPTYIAGNFRFFYHTIRFFLAEAWVKHYSYLYKWILLCDIKDILFQSNPFSFYKKLGLYFQQEDYKRFGKEGIVGVNKAWINPYKPNSMLFRNPIINSGQIIGDSTRIKIFLLDFCDFMNNTQIVTAEQGSLNYFIYSKTFKGKYKNMKNGYGFALITHSKLLRTLDNLTPINNYLFNYDGTTPSLVHGYTIGIRIGSKNRIRNIKNLFSFIQLFNNI